MSGLFACFRWPDFRRTLRKDNVFSDTARQVRGPSGRFRRPRRNGEYAAGACPAGVSLFDGFASDRVSSGHFRVRAAYGPFQRRGKRNGCSPQSGKQPLVYGAGRVSQASMLAYLAFRSMNSRRGGTSSPISIEKMRSASAALSIVTWRRMRVCGFMVVSHNCSAFISPRPL